MLLGSRGPVLLVIALLAAVLGLQLQGTLPTAAALRQHSGAAVAPHPATERYLEGVRQRNADVLWPVLSDELKVSWLEQGRTKGAVQQQFDRLARQNREVEKVTYVGGYDLGKGNTMYFYLVTSQGESGSSNADYVFVVDKGSGKISSVSRA